MKLSAPQCKCIEKLTIICRISQYLIYHRIKRENKFCMSRKMIFYLNSSRKTSKRLNNKHQIQSRENSLLKIPRNHWIKKC